MINTIIFIINQKEQKGMAYPAGALEFTLNFSRVRVAQSLVI
jgi:hypothetical protein